MATNPKIKPCPNCGSAQLNVYKYDSGWRYVECDGGFNARPHCGYRGPGEGSIRWAIKAHNEECITTRRRQHEATEEAHEQARPGDGAPDA